MATNRQISSYFRIKRKIKQNPFYVLESYEVELVEYLKRLGKIDDYRKMVKSHARRRSSMMSSNDSIMGDG